MRGRRIILLPVGSSASVEVQLSWKNKCREIIKLSWGATTTSVSRQIEKGHRGSMPSIEGEEEMRSGSRVGSAVLPSLVTKPGNIDVSRSGIVALLTDDTLYLVVSLARGEAPINTIELIGEALRCEN
jgi:hypothetical protein